MHLSRAGGGGRIKCTGALALLLFLLLNTLTAHSGARSHSAISCTLIFSRTHLTNIPKSEDPRWLPGEREGGRYTLVEVYPGINCCTLWY